MTTVPGRQVACLGLIGTIVAEEGTLERAYAEAIATQGVVTGTTAYARCMAQVHRSRGKAVIDVLRELFPDNEARAQAASLAFDKSLTGAIQRSGLRPVPGAARALDEIAEAGYLTCLVSTFSRRQLDVVLTALDWHGRADLALSTDEVPRGCPSPDPVLQAMLALHGDDVRDTVVVQATESGILSGCRAGARLVAAVTTGIHPAARLRAAGATHVLASIADVPALLRAAQPLAAPVPPPAPVPPAALIIPRPAPEAVAPEAPLPRPLRADEERRSRPNPYRHPGPALS